MNVGLFILFDNVSRFRTAQLYGCDTLGVCKACDLSIGEIVHFLDSDREHMQQGFFPDVQRSYVLTSAIAFDEV